jgi:hypothetical protein
MKQSKKTPCPDEEMGSLFWDGIKKGENILFMSKPFIYGEKKLVG